MTIDPNKSTDRYKSLPRFERSDSPVPPGKIYDELFESFVHTLHNPEQPRPAEFQTVEVDSSQAEVWFKLSEIDGIQDPSSRKEEITKFISTLAERREDPQLTQEIELMFFDPFEDESFTVDTVDTVFAEAILELGAEFPSLLLEFLQCDNQAVNNFTKTVQYYGLADIEKVQDLVTLAIEHYGRSEDEYFFGLNQFMHNLSVMSGIDGDLVSEVSLNDHLFGSLSRYIEEFNRSVTELRAEIPMLDNGNVIDMIEDMDGLRKTCADGIDKIYDAGGCVSVCQQVMYSIFSRKIKAKNLSKDEINTFLDSFLFDAGQIECLFDFADKLGLNIDPIKLYSVDLLTSVIKWPATIANYSKAKNWSFADNCNYLERTVKGALVDSTLKSEMATLALEQLNSVNPSLAKKVAYEALRDDPNLDNLSPQVVKDCIGILGDDKRLLDLLISDIQDETLDGMLLYNLFELAKGKNRIYKDREAAEERKKTIKNNGIQPDGSSGSILAIREGGNLEAQQPFAATSYMTIVEPSTEQQVAKKTLPHLPILARLLAYPSHKDYRPMFRKLTVLAEDGSDVGAFDMLDIIAQHSHDIDADNPPDLIATRLVQYIRDKEIVFDYKQVPEGPFKDFLTSIMARYSAEEA